ncbi:MAG TPA: efflux RND transporter periplasmic adaptor subunit [Tepidisphaeraceae bacterium]|nr:efflux RND transporter periplasmic adaptor subunit [Tepidisphaeraceae bacterium]
MNHGRPRGFAKSVVIAAAFLAVGGVSVVLFWMSRPAVTVTEVIEGPVIQAFYATGTVRPRLEYPISSSVAGIVERVMIRQGEAAKKGEPLALVVDPNLQFQADKARAELKTRQQFVDPEKSPVLRQFDRQITATQQMLDAAKNLEDRFTSLAQRSAASANDRDQALEHTRKIWGDLESLKAQRAAKLRELQQDVETAESADRAAQENLSRQTVRSPIDGVVLDEPIAQGTRIEINGHLMQLADLGPKSLIMRAAVDEENIAGVDKDQQVKMTLYSFPGRTFDGIVEQKYPKADATRRTFDVDVRFAAVEPRLQPGMTGELAFIEQTRERALIVPTQAVQDNAIWTLRSGRLVKSDATIGIRSIERTEVTGGLRAGDVVVISPISGLAEGDLARIGSRIDPKVAADLNKPKAVDVLKAFQ